VKRLRLAGVLVLITALFPLICIVAGVRHYLYCFDYWHAEWIGSKRKPKPKVHP
jgi:hypothetical protein